MIREELPFCVTPHQFLNLAHFFSSYDGTILFFSGGSFLSSQESYLWLFPKESFTIDSWQTLQDKLGSLNEREVYPKWAGFLSYELGAQSDPDKMVFAHKSNFPLAYFQSSNLVIHLTHETQKVIIYFEKEFFNWAHKLQEKSFWKTYPEYSNQDLKIIQQIIDLKKYTAQIHYIQEMIREGEVYQVNLSHEIILSGKCDPFMIYKKAFSKNPMPFSAYLKTKDFTIVSLSPERLLQKKGNKLQTWPIKGTIARGKNPAEDKKKKAELLNSEKERAELLMITDLARNDLGKVSHKRSIQVEKLFTLEKYKNVFHMHSQVTSLALPKHPLELIRACFPGGSVTGCPKIRAQELISEIEQRPRGIYTGSMGYFLSNGDFDFNIAIRTLCFQNDSVSLQLGGAIVIDSDPLKEYEETLHKGKTLLEVLNGNNFSKW